MWVLTVGWTLVLLSVLPIWLLTRSPWGRVLKAIREDEDAVRALGKNVYAYKMQSLIVGGVIGSFGRHDARHLGPVGAARQLRHGHHVLRLRLPASWAVPPPSGGRWSGR